MDGAELARAYRDKIQWEEERGLDVDCYGLPLPSGLTSIYHDPSLGWEDEPTHIG